MAEEKKPPYDFAAHPWLIGFEGKNDKEKLEAMIEQINCLENLIGVVSVIVIIAGSIVITLMGLSIISGSFSLSGLASVFKMFGG
jgi:hypothetical protein